MELFIRLQNGQPFEHPIFEDNFRQAFPDVDVENLPPEFAQFIRVPQPTIDVYEVYEGVTYERNGNGFTDVHHVRPMTDEEKTAKQNETKLQWEQHGFASWVFDAALCGFQPPVKYPLDGHPYKWDEAAIAWVKVVPE